MKERRARKQAARLGIRPEQLDEPTCLPYKREDTSSQDLIGETRPIRVHDKQAALIAKMRRADTVK